MRTLAALALFLFAASPYAIAQASKPAPAKSSPGNAVVGKKDFLIRCSACHGMDAVGKTPMADTLGGIPDLHSKKAQALTDAQIKKTITEGYGNMPPVPDVTGPEVANLTAFIRSLVKK